MTTLGGIVLTLCVPLAYSYWKDSNFWCVRRTVRAIKHATVDLDDAELFLPRKPFQAALLGKATSSPSRTLVVMGPRGSGKTTLVNLTFAPSANVIRIHLDTTEPFSAEEFSHNILTVLRVYPPPPHMSTRLLLEQAFKKFAEPPLLLVEADTRCGAKQLEQLLLLLKWWAGDLNAVRPVVLLAASRAAFSLKLRLSELRARPFVVPDLTEAEGEQLLWTMFSKLVTCTEEEFSQLCKQLLLPKLGTRPLNLTDFATHYKEEGTLHTLQEVTDVAAVFLAHERLSYKFALQAFVEKLDTSSHACFEALFAELKSHPVQLDSFLHKLNLTPDELVNLLNSSVTHPFFIDLGRREVCLNSVVEKDLDVNEFLKKKKT